MNILILGHNGLLGNCVNKYLLKYYNTSTTNHRFPDPKFLDIINNFNGEYIINCIGNIPHKYSTFDINTILPIYLDTYAKCNIIHPSTDCEKDITLYGLSKKIATDWILAYGKRTKIIQSSIIGIELNTNLSLLSWVLSQKKEINGHSDAMWNGITTLEWAKQVKHIMNNWSYINTLSVIGTQCISKYELIDIIIDIFDLKLQLNKVDGIGKNKCLECIHTKNNIKQQLVELKDFYEQFN
jgi:dTDP-4-dehydrorhamnose reductase